MIIGFAGKAASGKTTAAKKMEKVLDKKTITIPMAMLLRDEVEAFLRRAGGEEFVPLVYGNQDDKLKVFHIDQSQALNNCDKWPNFIAEHQDIQDRKGQTAVTVRRILQWWGTEYRRNQDADYWTKAWARKVGRLALAEIHVLIDDVRFINELDIIKQQGGVIYKIERPGFDGANAHASETSLDDYQDWAGIIRNDGTLEEFLQKVKALALRLQAQER